VYLLGSADKTNGGEAKTPGIHRFLCRPDDLGMVGQAQVIVGAEIQYHFSVRNGNL
jgi:plastocyanin